MDHHCALKYMQLRTRSRKSNTAERLIDKMQRSGVIGVISNLGYVHIPTGGLGRRMRPVGNARWGICSLVSNPVTELY